MTVKTLKDLFIHSLSDVYSAEKQLTRALPRLARAAPIGLTLNLYPVVVRRSRPLRTVHALSR